MKKNDLQVLSSALRLGFTEVMALKTEGDSASTASDVEDTIDITIEEVEPRCKKGSEYVALTQNEVLDSDADSRRKGENVVVLETAQQADGSEEAKTKAASLKDQKTAEVDISGSTIIEEVEPQCKTGSEYVALTQNEVLDSDADSRRKGENVVVLETAQQADGSEEAKTKAASLKDQKTAEVGKSGSTIIEEVEPRCKTGSEYVALTQNEVLDSDADSRRKGENVVVLETAQQADGSEEAKTKAAKLKGPENGRSGQIWKYNH